METYMAAYLMIFYVHCTEEKRIGNMCMYIYICTSTLIHVLILINMHIHIHIQIQNCEHIAISTCFFF